MTTIQRALRAAQRAARPHLWHRLHLLRAGAVAEGGGRQGQDRDQDVQGVQLHHDVRDRVGPAQLALPHALARQREAILALRRGVQLSREAIQKHKRTIVRGISRRIFG